MAKKTSSTAVRTVSTDQKMYEIMLVLKPDFLESGVTKKLKEFTKFLEENEAKVVLEDIWGKKDLAYRIKKYDQGIYVVYNILSKGSFLKELNDHIRIDTEVIRSLITSVDNDYKYEKFVEEETPKSAPRKEKVEVKEKEVKKLDEKLNSILEGDDLNI